MVILDDFYEFPNIIQVLLNAVSRSILLAFIIFVNLLFLPLMLLWLWRIPWLFSIGLFIMFIVSVYISGYAIPFIAQKRSMKFILKVIEEFDKRRVRADD